MGFTIHEVNGIIDLVRRAYIENEMIDSGRQEVRKIILFFLP